ncbi:MAG TPA: kelch repeat-containing protein, partial [Candidatus Binataceae bacterium]|nr:kelch repeat-containing protein [Candidatus Binataceae bacterium]
MNRSRFVLLLTGLAILIGGVAVISAPKASATATLSKPKLMFEPKPLNVGVVYPGFTLTSQPLSVVNVNGNAPATISAVSINSPFKISSDGCTGVTLQPAQSCAVVVQFSPTKKGKFSQPLKITVAGDKTAFKISVSGTASLSGPTITPTPPPSPTPTPPTPTPTPAPAVAPTAAGDVFLLGGYASLPVIYDPVAETASPSGSFDSFAGGVDGGELPENYRSVALPSGQILIAGGDDGTNAFANAYIYNPATQTVAPTGSMNQARTQFTLTLLNNGQVLAVGGSDTYVNTGNLSAGGGSATLGSAEIYDPPSKTWTEVASLVVARLAHTATLMPDGTVMVVGGLTDNSSASGYTLAQDYEFFTPPASSASQGSWRAETILVPSVPRYDHSAVLLDNGWVILVGGEVAPSAVATPARYITGSDSWGAISSEKTPRYDDAVTKLANGDVLIAGGLDANGDQLSTAETFSTDTLTWTTAAGSLPDGASGQTAALMADGRVIIAGGSSPTVATFDYSTEQFTPGGTLPS